MTDASSAPDRFGEGVHRARMRIYLDLIGGGGHVYNGHYLTLFERARADLFRDLEAREPDMPRHPYPRYLPVAVQQQFKRPLYAGDEIVIRTRIAKVGRSSCVIEHSMLRGEEEAATARVSLVFTDEAGRPTEQPRDWIAAFARAAGPTAALLAPSA